MSLVTQPAVRYVSWPGSVRVPGGWCTGWVHRVGAWWAGGAPRWVWVVGTGAVYRGGVPGLTQSYIA